MFWYPYLQAKLLFTTQLKSTYRNYQHRWIFTKQMFWVHRHICIELQYGFKTSGSTLVAIMQDLNMLHYKHDCKVVNQWNIAHIIMIYLFVGKIGNKCYLPAIPVTLFDHQQIDRDHQNLLCGRYAWITRPIWGSKEGANKAVDQQCALTGSNSILGI